MIQYEYFDNGSLLVIKYLGKIYKPTLESFIKFILTETDASKVKYILSDYRESELMFVFNDLPEIAKVRRQYTQTSNRTRTVFFVNNPKDTAFTTLISSYYGDITTATICSTLECCCRNLMLDIELEALNDRLNHLKFIFDES